MTDAGLIYRGYYRVPCKDLWESGVTNADAVFEKDFMSEAGEVLYTLVIEKYDAHMVDGQLVGPHYIGMTVVHSEEFDKDIGLNFPLGWSIDEMEAAMAKMCQSGMMISMTRITDGGTE